jgi:hypothetical protein
MVGLATFMIVSRADVPLYEADLAPVNPLTLCTLVNP